METPVLVFIGFMGAGKTTGARAAAAAVVGEAMVALTLAAAYREKFGGDHIDDVHAALAAYKERIGWKRRRPSSS